MCDQGGEGREGGDEYNVIQGPNKKRKTFKTPPKKPILPCCRKTYSPFLFVWEGSGRVVWCGHGGYFLGASLFFFCSRCFRAVRGDAGTLLPHGARRCFLGTSLRPDTVMPQLCGAETVYQWLSRNVVISTFLSKMTKFLTFSPIFFLFALRGMR